MASLQDRKATATKTVSTPQEVAAHEAGHAAVSLYLRLAVEAVGIDQSGSFCEYPFGPLSLDPVNLHLRMVRTAAGAAAAKLAGFPGAGAEDDEQTLAPMADAIRAAAPDWEAPDPVAKADAILSKPSVWLDTMGIARGILQHGVLRGPAISRAAGSLYLHGTAIIRAIESEGHRAAFLQYVG